MKAPVIRSRAAITTSPAVDARLDLSGINRGAQSLAGSITKVADDWARGLRVSALNDAEVKTAESLAAIEEKWLQVNDPDEIETGFEDELNSIKQDILGGITHHGDRRAFEAKLINQTLASGRRVASHKLNLVGARALGQLDTAMAALTKNASSTDALTDRAVYIDSARSLIEQNIEAGWITAVKGAQMERAFNNRLSNIDALRLIEENPEEALKALGDENRFAALEPEERLKLREAARVDIAQQARAAKSHASEMATAARSGLSEINTIIGAGGTPAAELISSTKAYVQASGDTALVRDYNESLYLAETQRGYIDMTPSELQATISQIETSGPTDRLSAKQLTLGKSILSSMKTALENDPLSWAARTGAFELTAIRPDQPVDPATARSRIDAAARIAARYAVRPRYLTDEERTSFADFLEAAAPDSQLAFLASLNSSFGARSQNVLEELSRENSFFAHVGGLAQLGGFGSAQAATARRALTGAKALKDNKDLKIDPATRVSAIDAVGLDALGTQTSLRANVLKVADALYADAFSRGLVSDNLDDGFYQKAINSALGGTDGRGGIDEINGFSTILPSSHSASAVELAVRFATDADLQAASVGGGAPRHGGTKKLPFTAKELTDAKLIAVGDGRYLVDRDGSDQARILGTGQDGYYVLDMNKLIALTSARPVIPEVTTYR